jgi:rhodanese-related sulfurtransferase
MQHSKRFLALVDAARAQVREIDVPELKDRLARNPHLVFLDVREESEWSAGHAAGARHLGKGVLERDLESQVPDVETEIVMYCGGGYRSMLACEAAQRMGYRNVSSLAGGFRDLVGAGWEIRQDS